MTKILSFLLILSILFGLAACGKTDKSGQQIDTEITLSPSNAEQDIVMFTNPDRGFRMEAYTNLFNIDSKSVASQITSTLDKFELAANSVKSGIWQKPTLTQVYMYLTEFKNTETLPDIVFKNIDAIFEAAKNAGMKCLVRFSYMTQMHTPQEQASEEIMLAHMKQLAPYLEKHKDWIHTVEAGFLGAWGEWHSYPTHSWNNHGNFETTTYVDEEKLLRAIIDMTPDDLFLQVRYSGIKSLIPKDDPAYKRIGFHNDSFFGHTADILESEDTPLFSTDSLYAPMGGEFYWGSEWQPTYPDVTAISAIRLYKLNHQNSFSVYHNSFEGTEAVAGTPPNNMWYYTEREGNMSEWAWTPITKDLLDKYDVFYSDAWFNDRNGNEIERTGFEFVRDHLGYRIEGKSLSIKGELKPEAELDLNFKFQNYGFSAAFNMISEFVILDSRNKVVASVKAGNPLDWNNGESLKTFEISCKIKLPKESGKYKLGFYLHNSAGTGAYIANNIERLNGFNVFCDFEI